MNSDIFAVLFSLFPLRRTFPAESRAALSKLIEIFESEGRTFDTSNETGKSLTILFNGK